LTKPIRDRSLLHLSNMQLKDNESIDVLKELSLFYPPSTPQFAPDVGAQ